jgi:hypothetical protein
MLRFPNQKVEKEGRKVLISGIKVIGKAVGIIALAGVIWLMFSFAFSL